MPSQLPPLTATPPPTAKPNLELRGYSYEDRREILPALAEALAESGCWVHGSKTISVTQVEYRFELPLRAAVDLYSGLIGSGLELTRSSHRELTELCTLCCYPRPQQLGRIVDVRLEVSFVEEIEIEPEPAAIYA